MTIDAPAASRSPVDLLGEQRAVIVRHLKDRGAATVPELADVLGISEVAARRHVDRLASDGLIAGEKQNRGRGRPVTAWSLSVEGEGLFPHRYDQVAHELLAFLGRDGRTELGEFLRWRQDRQVERLADRIDADELPARLEQLAAALTEAGYRAEVDDDGDGFVLRQTHCTIADVARDEPLLCAHEAAAFGRVLGKDVSVTRRETLATGDAACVCHVAIRQPVPGALPVLPVDSPVTSCTTVPGPPATTTTTTIGSAGPSAAPGTNPDTTPHHAASEDHA